MDRSTRLPFNFDVKLLKKELKILEEAFEVSLTPRTEPKTYWIINLMVPDLEAERVKGVLPFKWHPILDKCSYFMEVLNTFPCRFQRVMIRKLNLEKVSPNIPTPCIMKKEKPICQNPLNYGLRCR